MVFPHTRGGRREKCPGHPTREEKAHEIKMRSKPVGGGSHGCSYGVRPGGYGARGNGGEHARSGRVGIKRSNKWFPWRRRLDGKRPPGSGIK